MVIVIVGLVENLLLLVILIFRAIFTVDVVIRVMSVAVVVDVEYS